MEKACRIPRVMNVRAKLIWVAMLCGPAALGFHAMGDVNNLSNGAFIAHHPAAMAYSTDPPAEGYYAAFVAGHAITDCEGQVNEIAGSGETKLWFVLAAWTEDKVWAGASFGIDYSPGETGAYGIMEYGACRPGAGLEIESPGWPDPGAGVSLVVTDLNWEGNFLPVYYFAGYTYGPGQVQIIENPVLSFCGTANVNNVQFPIAEGYRGALGVGGTLGTHVCPPTIIPGACCFDGGNTCQVLLRAECVGMGGHFKGEDTVCDPNPCPTTWACCIGDLCFMLSEDECVNEQGGRWLVDRLCAEATCTAAACCLQGECLMLRDAECADLGGSWHPEWPSCEPNPCRRILRVTPDGSGEYATIQSAIDAAYPGDTILLSDGIYRGSGNRDISFAGKPLLVASESGDPSRCIIDCQGDALAPRRGFLFQNGETNASLVDGISIIHGYAPPDAGSGGGAILCRGASPVVRNCILWKNTAEHGAAIACASRSSPLIRGCTIHANTALSADAGAVSCRSSSMPSIDRCLITGTINGRAIECDPMSQPQLSCCDLFGNAAGDYTGCTAGFLGAGGNIRSDPQFCAPDSGNFHLACVSPCLTASGCGQIGALGRGCSFFTLIDIDDIPNDQGRQVRVSWRRTCDDAPAADTTITAYSVWRRVDAGALLRYGADTPDWAKLRPWEYPPGLWDFVCMVPACGETSYSTVCPTLGDSTISAGQYWSVFFVRAHTTSPTVYIDTPPDSGYSVDNLAPAPPANLRLAGIALIAWEEAREEDFAYYSIHGSPTENMGGAQLLGYTSGTSFSIAGICHEYYHVAATDFSGNQGLPASIHVSGAVVVPGEVPQSFALHACHPSPFATSTTIAFDVPSPTHAAVNIYDPGGRLVRTLIAGHLPPSSFALHWAGTDDAGRELPRGVYFVHLAAGEFRATARVVLLR